VYRIYLKIKHNENNDVLDPDISFEEFQLDPTKYLPDITDYGDGVYGYSELTNYSEFDMQCKACLKEIEQLHHTHFENEHKRYGQLEFENKKLKLMLLYKNTQLNKDLLKTIYLYLK
jgi:hypothetical protein